MIMKNTINWWLGSKNVEMHLHDLYEPVLLVQDWIKHMKLVYANEADVDSSYIFMDIGRLKYFKYFLNWKTKCKCVPLIINLAEYEYIFLLLITLYSHDQKIFYGYCFPMLNLILYAHFKGTEQFFDHKRFRTK